MDRFFDEGIKLDSKYNRVPEGMRTEQFVQCAGCDYRIYRMQWRRAQQEAREKGGSPRTYMAGFLIRPLPSCKRRERCLIDNLYLSRGAKAPPSFIKRLLNQKIYVR